MRLVLLSLVLLVSACIEPTLRYCDGVACPTTTTCVDGAAGYACVDGSLITACSTLDDGDTCSTTDYTGTC